MLHRRNGERFFSGNLLEPCSLQLFMYHEHRSCCKSKKTCTKLVQVCWHKQEITYCVSSFATSKWSEISITKTSVPHQHIPFSISTTYFTQGKKKPTLSPSNAAPQMFQRQFQKLLSIQDFFCHPTSVDMGFASASTSLRLAGRRELIQDA